VDLDKRANEKHEHEKAAIAVANRHTFDAGSELAQEPVELIYDHLKRLGLQQYASLFESYGFFTKGSCAELAWSSVEKWCKDPSMELSFDKKVGRRAHPVGRSCNSGVVP
jgi:hypothetical protein